ncbi:trypsin-like serine protease with C-terminal PDZ domain [Thioflavicoccus mobilis 8321]|uniref:Trypsin-like serine protease with C-terminal PDZ domain n=1 Tax=Thioflavicoccus mobilis 8321 TaxID=765912 RepID=L0GWY1_9GAMM|nr:trypsin-like serine protease with C-terminal PDZ domain [Thioflavicoccus mobilis 8321]
MPFVDRAGRPGWFAVARRSRMLGVILALALVALAGCDSLPQQSSASSAVRVAPPLAAAGDGATFPYRKARGGYPSLAPLLKRVTPAVVNISVVSEVAKSQHPFLRDPDFRRFLEKFDLPMPDFSGTERRQSVGSGVIVDGNRGVVLTNYHLIEDAKEVTVTLKDQRSYAARLLGGDARADVAVLQIKPVEIANPRFGNSDELEVGDFVIAIGNPFGLGQTVTSGIVSAVGRSGIAGSHLGDLIQTDASINPGNSGGPLINLAGEVVGINTALIGPTGGNVGIGFAVPSNRVRVALDRVLARR